MSAPESPVWQGMMKNPLVWSKR